MAVKIMSEMCRDCNSPECKHAMRTVDFCIGNLKNALEKHCAEEEDTGN